MDGSILEEKPSFKMLRLTVSSKLDWDSYLIPITKTGSKKVGATICSMKFLLQRFLCISINLPYANVWNIVHVWCPKLLPGIVRKATKSNMQDC